MHLRPRQVPATLFRTLAAAGTLLLCLADPATSQTVIQHGWEDGTLQGWAPFGGGVLTNTTAAANTGARSLLTTGRTAGFNGPSLQLGATLTPGTVYQFTAFVRLAPGEAATQVRMTMQRTPTGGSAVFEQVAGNTTVTETGWVMVQGQYSFTGSASSLLTYIESTSATASYYVDDFSIRVVPAAGCSDPPDTSGIHSNFETGTREGWGPRIGRETVAVTNSDAHSGTFSLLTTGRQAAFDGAAINAAGKLCNGSRYTVSCGSSSRRESRIRRFGSACSGALGTTTTFHTVIGNTTVLVWRMGAAPHHLRLRLQLPEPHPVRGEVPAGRRPSSSTISI